MKIDKQFILRNLITIFCALCIIALFFTFVSSSVKVESDYVGSQTQETTVSGWSAVSGYLLGWLLVIGPVLLVAMNYIQKLEKFKGLLAIVVPILCIIILFFTLSDAKASTAVANNAVGAVSDAANSVMDDMDLGSGSAVAAKAETSAGLGFYLLLIANIGIIISGAVTYFGLRLNDLSSVKESGKAILNSAREVTISNREENTVAPAEKTVTRAPAAKPKATESVIKSSAEDALQLIERLAKMRDSGILTEEEFQEKKRELLKGV